MFNTGQFNLLRFDAYTTPGDDWQDVADMTASVYAVILHGGNWYEMTDMPAATGTRTSGAAALLETADLHGDFDARVQAFANYGTTDAVMAAFGARTDGSVILKPRSDLATVVAASVRIGANTRHAETMAAVWLGGAYMSRDLRVPGTAMDAFFASQVSTFRFEYLDAYIDIPIPPGSTLVLDSNGYVVLLDGEDVIWAHTGDWLMLDRSTHDVVFEFVGGQAVDKQILYTERWL